VPFDVVPMSVDRVATRVTLADDAISFDKRHYRRGETISFQEYFVRLRHDVAISRVEFAGVETAKPNGLDLLGSTRFVVIAPSNPIVSIGPIRALRGVNDALSRRRHSVVGISPIIGGAALKGPADRMLRELGMEPTALGVARLYADVCGVFVIDRVDAELAPMIEQLGMRCIVAETVMSDDDTARQLAAHVIEAMS
jgi:LPPG:FO 2-phospho-L-lactate transferase